MDEKRYSNSTFKNIGAEKKRHEELIKNAEAIKEFPKLGNTYDSVNYDHTSTIFGVSLGLTEQDAANMAAKFKMAEKKAKEEDGKAWLSKTVANVLPTLTPGEIAFCVGMLVMQKAEREGLSFDL